MDVWRSIILKNLNLFAEGLWVTTQICVIAFCVACALGLGACLVRLYVRPLRLPATIYIEFCRNTPIYVQLLWVNYVWPDDRAARLPRPQPDADGVWVGPA